MNSKLIDVNIIIPYKDNYNYLISTLNSLFSQTYKKYKILIIYDDENQDDLEQIRNFLARKKRMKKESSYGDCGCGCNDCDDEIKLAGVKKEYQNPQGGLNAKGRAYFKRTQGSNLKRPVSMRQAKKSPKSAARRRSFCSRMGGMKRKHNIDCSKNPDKSICKALRKWDC